ncbi:unnamed protein product [Rhizoctonia solani]|uniref:Protein kinase domain-containing protein n=1 Tax=Rhizoctonia solani TaxID=456999 RepID=A0A8H3DXC7_9AGAM|nr:unnamed protein product [Rhizoctonia solani]
MHGRSTVHGDLKALNVLVSSDGIARISDFDYSIISGVNHSLMFSVSSSNSRPATVRWAAPELLGEQPQSKNTQTDVYALGMTMLVNQRFTFGLSSANCKPVGNIHWGLPFSQ